jgi:hypothetical protein
LSAPDAQTACAWARQQDVGHRDEAVSRSAREGPLRKRRCDGQRRRSCDVAHVDFSSECDARRAPVGWPERPADPWQLYQAAARERLGSLTAPSEAEQRSMIVDGLPALGAADVDGTSAAHDVWNVGRGEDADHCDRLAVDLPHVGDEWWKWVDLGTDHAAQVGLEVKPLWLGPTFHGPVVGHAEQNPSAQRIGEGAGGRAEPRWLGEVLLALDKEIFAVAYEFLERWLIERRKGEPADARRPGHTVTVEGRSAPVTGTTFRVDGLGTLRPDLRFPATSSTRPLGDPDRARHPPDRWSSARLTFGIETRPSSAPTS